MKVSFSLDAFSDYEEWALYDEKTFRRTNSLIKDIARNPFNGLGKPEPLKYDFSSYYSRRIDSENRLVYKVSFDEILIISCKYYYNDK